MACGPNSRGLMARGPDPNAFFPVRSVAARDGVNFAPRTPAALWPAGPTPAALWPAGPTPTPSSQSVFCALRPIGCYELLDPLQPSPQLVLRLRVGDADVPLPRLTERRPGKHRNTRLRQESIRQLPLPKPRALDIRERVEGSLRPRAADAGDFVEAIDDEVPAMLEHLDHSIHRMRRLRRGQRFNGSDLRERGRARR